MTSGPRPGPLLVLLLVLAPPGSEEACPSVCLCVSDTVSCSSSGLTKLPLALPSFSTTLDLSHNYFTWLYPGSFQQMPRLENLRMAHNQMASLGQEVFRNASGLRHLDLSSNWLRLVEQHYFQGLWRLEELLLFNNKIAQVEDGALSGLSSLKKAYFSINEISSFPFSSIRDHSHPFLAMLDLSSNRMSRLPWEDVKALPGLAQRGLYLHNNSLICDCSMYSIFWHWNLRGYEPVREFADEHTCTIDGSPRAALRFLRRTRFFRNCTVEKAISLPVTVYLSHVVVTDGARVRLDCKTSLRSPALSFRWLSPSMGPITETAFNDTLVDLLPNGTLDIRAARVNDSGLYVCTAADAKRALNATREVNVTVLLPGPESFNTGFTTLTGCAITLVGILAYLFMTPCRCGCRCCRHPRSPAVSIATYDPDALTLASVLSHPVTEQHRMQTNRRVAFMDDGLTDWDPES
uniref:Ig-like domain-containing protein n=1 Tax=Gasterosteus aculeatus aculeatus TaxID=481459 RepID=A0AAQ4PWA9_GASAC|nr:amphoterin-induced protein 3-like [Gasterosteus aculeatus aculeatus]